MGTPIKPIINLANFSKKQLEKVADKTLVAKQKLSEQLIVKTNKKVAEKYAVSIGLKPIKNSEKKIKKLLNEKIIQVVQLKKLTHLNLAISAQTPRTRVTALLNRHVSQFSIDAMMKILWILGTTTKIDLIDR